MRHQPPTLSLLLLPFVSIVCAGFLFYPDNSVTSQTPSTGAEIGRRSGTTLPPLRGSVTGKSTWWCA